MKKISYMVLLVCLIGISNASIAQKVKYKFDKDTELVSKNGVDYVKVEKKGCGFGPECRLSIFDKNGNKIMIVSVESFKDPSATSKSNPEGTVRFATYHFPSLDKKAEYAYSFIKPSKLVKKIDDNELLNVDTTLNEKAVNEFVEVNGMKFSAQRDSIIKVITN